MLCSTVNKEMKGKKKPQRKHSVLELSVLPAVVMILQAYYAYI